MKPTHILLISGTFVLCTLATLAPVHAGSIENACISSGRRAANHSTCSCIQRVADQLLTGSEQRLAATFFKDPHKAQEVRQSDSTSDEKFWRRYKQFGSVASSSCG